MVVHLDEPAQVGAVFKKGNVVPLWFLYHNRKIPVKEVTFSWKERIGDTLLHHFSVSDGTNLYDLVFQPEQMFWRLASVEEDTP